MILRIPAFLFALLVFSSCQKKSSEGEVSDRPDRAAIQALVKSPPGPDPAGAADRAGALVQIHCGRCHLAPQPSVLTQKLWVNVVLPEMGCYLGVHHYIPQYKSFIEKGTTAEEDEAYVERAIYSKQPLIPQADWDAIVTFYLQNSPAEMPPSNNVRPPDLPEGKFELAFVGPPNPTPETTLIQIDEAGQRFIASDNAKESLSFYDPAGKLLHSKKGVGTFTAAHLEDGAGLQHFLEVGVLNPNDQIAGALWTNSVGDSLDRLSKTSLPSLKRPVSAVWYDLDHDGRDEVVVAEYGNKTGQLRLFHQDATGGGLQTVLNAASGNIVIKVADMNQDGWEDLVVLRAQESEDVLIYYNTGNLEFLQSTALKLPPYWGSNEMDLADFNGDGHLDLLLANGDNADSTPVLKNFHGVRLYLNDGKGGFTEKFNFPLHGAYGVRAFDHDLDGDLDLIAFSTFADFKNDQVTIYLLEQTAPLEFQPYAIPQSTKSRWIVMDVGDLDGDGDEDVAFGPFVPGPSALPAVIAARAQALSGPFLILKNLAKP